MKRALTLAALLIGSSARADVAPWVDRDDVPLPDGVKSVVPRKGDMFIFEAPGRGAGKRGLSENGATLPLYGAKRAPGCIDRWLLVGPLAWVCSDQADLSEEDPFAPPRAASGPDGLPYSYFFAGRDGASAYVRLDSAGDDSPDRQLESGWAVAVVEQRTMHGERWGRTPHGQWISLREIFPAHPSLFHGEEIKDGSLDLAWVLSERAAVFAGPYPSRATGSKVRFERVAWLEAKGPSVRVSDREWMLARDLRHPTKSAKPDEVAEGERWIDVELATQTLVAYQGTTPTYATLVSSGRGPKGTDSATPPGVHRVYVKILSSTMDNVEKEDLEKHYSMEDVPYVQFFDKNVGLHGTYWHRDFGRIKSHGCVNLAPLDSKWLFDFTLPHLPAGWHAAYPTALEKGTVVRVR